MINLWCHYDITFSLPCFLPEEVAAKQWLVTSVWWARLNNLQSVKKCSAVGWYVPPTSCQVGLLLWISCDPLKEEVQLQVLKMHFHVISQLVKNKKLFLLFFPSRPTNQQFHIINCKGSKRHGSVKNVPSFNLNIPPEFWGRRDSLFLLGSGKGQPPSQHTY